MLMIVSEAVRGGVNVVQIREKGLSQDALARVCQTGDRQCERAVTLVNENVLVARLVGADGVHLPEKAPSNGFRRYSDGTLGSLTGIVQRGGEVRCSGFSNNGFHLPNQFTQRVADMRLGRFGRLRKRVNIPILGIGG